MHSLRTAIKTVFYLIVVLPLFALPRANANELHDFVARPEQRYQWAETSRVEGPALTAITLSLTSQEWRGQPWTHTICLFTPKIRKNDTLAFLFVTANAEKDQEVAQRIAESQGIVTAVLGSVPNQPLFGDLTEDRLIAYSFDQYRKSGDGTWPLLFPMVKSVVKAMDALSEATAATGHRVRSFIVSGASKRGWTTWLTGAVDPRVVAIAPLVFDMLNMKAQLDWAVTSYGAQSEKIRPYTELGLVRDIDTAEIRRLRAWVDPYSYLPALKMPKLILLGANDRYWTVDAQQHYFPKLAGSKTLYIAPNFGHSLDRSEATWETLDSWIGIIAAGGASPELRWTVQNGAGNGKADGSVLSMSADRPFQAASIWQATATTRDFRDAIWSQSLIAGSENKQAVEGKINTPGSGFAAFFGEARFTLPGGGLFRASTEITVVKGVELEK